MEFYELNRLYDETLKYTKPSDRVDSYLYFLMPTVISFGCVISLISIYSFAMHGIASRQIARDRAYAMSDGDGGGGGDDEVVPGRPDTRHGLVHLVSKAYLYAQSVANFVFQLVTSVIFITNYYEKKLIDTYFQNNKNTYFSLKCLLNFVYNVLLYSVVWFVVVSSFDFCVVAIKKLNLHVGYSKHYRQMFERLIKSHQMHNLSRQQSQNYHSSGSSQHHKQQSIRHKPSMLKHQTSKHLEVDNRSHHTGAGVQLSSRTRCSSTTSCSYQPNEFISMDELNQQTMMGMGGSLDIPDDHLAAIIPISNSSSSIETDRIFCKTKTVYYSIFSIVLFSLMLAFPQIFAYEIKQNQISLSPWPMPKAGSPESISSYEHIYFVEGDSSASGSSLNNSAELNEHLKEEYLFRLLNRTSRSYSDTVGRALAYSVRIDRRNRHVREILSLMHKTHRRFFTQTGFFNLVSKQYEFCNVLKNSLDAAPIIMRPSPRSARAVIKVAETGEKINYFNLTLTCIKKNDLNSYLTYNTLYFWLEHTMVISVPFCVNLVVISSLIYTFLTFTKLQTNQYRFLLKRRRLSKLIKKGQSKNHHTMLINENHLSRKESKKYRAHKPGSEINIMSDEFMNELRELETYEARMIRAQHKDKNLTLMFILDLFFYFLISFPYTLMRLILDLFVKDKVKISLDFFVLFKSSLLAFHIHLIAKFFLMLALNANFRKWIAWAFSIQNSACWQQRGQENNNNNNNNSGGATRSSARAGSRSRRRDRGCLAAVCCCCCDSRRRRSGGGGGGGGPRGWWPANSSPTDSNVDAETSANMYKEHTSCSLNDENFYHSTEFNSNYHQFYCPAEPNESDIMPNLPSIASKNKLSIID